MSEAAARLQTFAQRNKGAAALFLVVIVGFACLALQPVAPWLFKWPVFLQIPATEWIGAGLGWLLDGFKPSARGFSALMGYPMAWANMLFVATPWPITIGVVTALGWYIGGWRMAALGLFGLGFVLASGYWVEGMNTLALVAVSVPLALIAGLAIGMLAYEYPRVKGVVQVAARGVARMFVVVCRSFCAWRQTSSRSSVKVTSHSRMPAPMRAAARLDSAVCSGNCIGAPR